MLADLQRRFRHAVLTGELAEAAAFVAPDDLAPERRVAVHRNTVEASLAGVLAAAYPALERLLTPDNFRLLARAFMAAHPPRRAHLSSYGGEMAGFLAGFPHTAGYTFLPDLARLEWARNEALFAADAPALSGHGLEGVPLERLAALALPPHPATRLVESAFAIQRLWEAPKLGPGVAAGAQSVLVTRSEAGAVQQRLATPGDAALLRAFAAGAPLAEAAEAALAAEADFDLQGALADHLRRATFTLPPELSPSGVRS
jgi:hypothetical protein